MKASIDRKGRRQKIATRKPVMPWKEKQPCGVRDTMCSSMPGEETMFCTALSGCFLVILVTGILQSPLLLVWPCTIQVIERHPILLNKLEQYPFQKRYRHYMFIDMQGAKIKAGLFDNDINFYLLKLLPSPYNFCYAFVQMVRAAFGSMSNPNALNH